MFLEDHYIHFRPYFKKSALEKNEIVKYSFRTLVIINQKDLYFTPLLILMKKIVLGLLLIVAAYSTFITGCSSSKL